MYQPPLQNVHFGRQKSATLVEGMKLSSVPMLPSRSWILHVTIEKNTLFIPITKHDFTIQLFGIQSSNHLWI